MCLDHPCYERLNRIAASKPMRICYGTLLVIFVAFACVRLLQASNHMHAQNNARLEVVPSYKDNSIHYDSSSAVKVVAKINDALSKYESPNPNRTRCDNFRLPGAGKSCNVELNEYQPCTKENGYGYQTFSPCIFLKLKKLEGWIPEVFNSSDYLPDDMPKYLKNYITNDHNHGERAIWVSCQGESDVDVEYIGEIDYYPNYGFPVYYFPAKNDDSYLEPLIAFQLKRPTFGIEIFIKCKIWAKNLEETATIKLLLDP